MLTTKSLQNWDFTKSLVFLFEIIVIFNVVFILIFEGYCLFHLEALLDYFIWFSVYLFCFLFVFLLKGVRGLRTLILIRFILFLSIPVCHLFMLFRNYLENLKILNHFRMFDIFHNINSVYLLDFISSRSEQVGRFMHNLLKC